MRLRTIVLLCAAVLLLAIGAAGQNVSSSMKGVVTDPGGAMVPSARCVLQNEETGATLTVTTDASGNFTFLNILSGSYTLTVEAAGFRALAMKNINVTASETHNLGRLTLEIGEVRQTVNVTAEGMIVQTATAEKSGLVTEHQIQNIAVKGRDFFTLMQTVPGVVDNFSQARETSTPDSIRGTFINGGRENAKNLAIDGITDLDTGSNSTVHFEPNMDAIQEVKIMTTNYQAEFGRNSGGVITVITKSGGSGYHGTVYDFYRHESLNANSFMNNRNGRNADGTPKNPKNPYRYRITGFSLGGPVAIPKVFDRLKEKFFFFWSEEWTGMKKDYGTQYATTPTQLERNGDFSKSYDQNGKIFPIADPLLTATGAKCSAMGDPGCFPNNVIPGARINKLGQSILNFFPPPNWTDPDPNQLYKRNHKDAYSGSYPKREDLVRIDANLSPKLQIYWRWVRDTDQQNTPWGMWVNGTVPFLLSPIVFGQPGKGQVAHLTSVFSPTLVNEFTFGKSRNHLYFDPLDPQAFDRSKMGNPPQWYPDTYLSTNYIPNVSFGGPRANYISVQPGNIPYNNWNDIYSFLDNVAKVWHGHNLKAGVYIERTGKFQVGGKNYRGAFNFSRDTNNPYDTGDGFSNALLGQMQTYTEATARVDGDWWFWNDEWYVQDNWKVNKHLTLDFGLRFYHMPAMEDMNRTLATFVPGTYSRAAAPALYVPAIDPVTKKRVAMDPKTGTLAPVPMIGLFVPNSGNIANGAAVGGKNGFPAGLYAPPWLALGPRFGFAWDVFGNGKTAIRGGIGIFPDRMQGNPTFDTNGSPPVTFQPTLWYGDVGSYAQAAGAYGPSSMNMLLGDQKLSTTTNYSLGVQHQVWNTMIDVSYVGSFSRHLLAQVNINPIPIGARFAPANQDPTNPGKPLPDNFLRPYFGYADLNYRTNGFSSNYNSLQMSANRRFSRGLQFGIAYTYSKTMGVADGDTSGVSPYFDYRTRNYGRLAYDRPQIFVLNYVYDMPKLGTKLTGSSGAGIPVRAVLDNWSISGMTSFQSGPPFTVGIGTTDGKDFTGSTEGARVNIIGNPILPKDKRTFNQWINPAAFARPADGTFGNAGGGNYICCRPGINNWDIAISKHIPLKSEGRFIQFRTEMFNAWNHTQYWNINTSTNFNPAGVQTNAALGQVNDTRPPRQIQLSLKVYF